MTDSENPLVSIGIPTYNRPDGLRRTLECMRGQSYGNLEIIVSDNASPDPRVGECLDECRAADPRVRVHVQPENRGAIDNFNFVLEQATGEYFLWAADDDEWSPTFIEDCLREFASAPPGTVAVALEAQYTRGPGRFEFFPEGRPFYAYASDRPAERLRHMLRYNYGNLYYSLFRREALSQDGATVFRCLDLKSFNEIPVLLFVMRQGNWRVSPRVGLYKSTTEPTYLQARWEMLGGRLPPVPMRVHLRDAFGNVLKYHLLALGDILSSLGRIRIGTLDVIGLRAMSCVLLGRHFLACLLRRKGRAF
jgi:glycosyltransferase involved in cell wall biosynthesis